MGRRVSTTVAAIGVLVVLLGLGIAVLGYGGSAGASEPDTKPPTISLTGTAVTAVEEGKTSGSYVLHISAGDGLEAEGQSGVAKAEVGVDGTTLQSWEKHGGCAESGCGLEETWEYVPSNFTSEPPHFITVRVIDHAGNATEEKLSVEGIEEVPREAAEKGTDTTDPEVGLWGPAVKAVEEGATAGAYHLHIAATDGSPTAPQSGVAKIELAVDGTTLQSWEKFCPVGSCQLEETWPYEPALFSGTGHVITMTVRDHAGNVATKTIEPTSTPPLVAAYSFEEGEGSIAEDISGNGHDGTLSAKGVEWAPGKYGTGLKFDGIAGCVSVPDSPALQLHEEFTLEAWVHPEGELTNLPVVYKAANGFPAYALGVGMATPGRADGQIGTAERSRIDVSSPASIEAGAWTHEAVTFEGSTLRLYLNGMLVATTATKLPAPAAAGSLDIGCSPAGHFRGGLDEVRLYGRALSVGEIASSMDPLPSVRTTEPYGFEAEEGVLAATVNPHGEATSYRFEYGLTDAYGSSAPEGPEFSEEVLSGNEPVEVEEVAEGLLPERTYHVRILARSAGGTAVGKGMIVKTPAEPANPAKLAEERRALGRNKKGSGFFDMNWNGNGSKTDNEETAKMVSASGSKMFRVVVNGVNSETEQLFQFEAQRGVQILPDLAGVPTAPNGHLIPPLSHKNSGGTTYQKEWEAKLREIVARFGVGGTFWAEHPALEAKHLEPEWWEIWNEPNFGPTGSENEKTGNGEVNPTEYGRLLEISHTVIQAVDPGAKILVGGLLSVGTEGSFPHMPVQEFIRRIGHEADYNAVGIHPYAFAGLQAGAKLKGETPVQHVTKLVRHNVKKARAALNKVAGGGSKKLWITEIGWPVKGDEATEDNSHRLVTPQVQEELLNSVFGMLKEYSASAVGSFQIQNVFYYNLQDNTEAGATPTPHHWDSHCGLREDTSGLGEQGKYRKEAWTAFQSQAEAPAVGAEP